MNESRGNRPLVIGIGEILWDIFPDGPRFGGAPANFVCTAAQLGQDHVRTGMVSAVGNDDLGNDALLALRERGVDVAGIARRSEPTGRVDVRLNDRGQATYEFAANTAWDHLSWSDDLAQIAEQTSAVCFGTLGQRNNIARTTIRQFLQATPTNAVKILDVNLRPPHWSGDVLTESLKLASVVKCNDEELPVIASRLQLFDADDAGLLEQIIDRCSLRLAVLTRGANGSLIVNQSGLVSERAAATVNVVDTVGAGDALTAAVAIGLLHEIPLTDMHRWADRVAAFVCTQSGATPLIPAELRCDTVFRSG